MTLCIVKEYQLAASASSDISRIPVTQTVLVISEYVIALLKISIHIYELCNLRLPNRTEDSFCKSTDLQRALLTGESFKMQLE